MEHDQRKIETLNEQIVIKLSALRCCQTGRPLVLHIQEATLHRAVDRVSSRQSHERIGHRGNSKDRNGLFRVCTAC
jgi:hypothetical protein